MALNKRYERNGLGLPELNKEQSALKRKVDKKIKNGDYNFEILNSCPLCKSEKSENLSEKDRYGFETNIVICKKCGLIYTNPRFDQSSYSKFYDSEYRGIYSTSTIANKDFWENQKKQGRKIFDYISKVKNIKGLKIAEIGVGAGGILKYFQEKDNDVIGVDLGLEYLNYGKDRGLDLIHGDIDELLNNKIKVDVLIYSHVFEHILDLGQELKKIKKVLKKDGLLYIEVPGVKNLDRSYEMDFLKSLQNAHTYYFTLNSLKNVLSLEGFSLVDGDEFVHSIFKFNNCTVDIDNEYSSTVAYLKKKEVRRRKIYPNKYVFLLRIRKHMILILKKLNLYKPLKSIYVRLK